MTYTHCTYFGCFWFATMILRVHNYDYVYREILWRILYEYGVGGRLLGSSKALYEGGRAGVKVEGMESQRFRVHKGARQGCALSVTLAFNGFVDKEARIECVRVVTPSTGSTSILACVDDMVMMAEMGETGQHNVETMNEVLIRWNQV